VFSLSPESEFVAEQWVGEESKSPKSGRTLDSVGWGGDDAGGWG
jgi:hypothetical protein